MSSQSEQQNNSRSLEIQYYKDKLNEAYSVIRSMESRKKVNSEQPIQNGMDSSDSEDEVKLDGSNTDIHPLGNLRERQPYKFYTVQHSRQPSSKAKAKVKFDFYESFQDQIQSPQELNEDDLENQHQYLQRQLGNLELKIFEKEIANSQIEKNIEKRTIQVELLKMEINRILEDNQDLIDLENEKRDELRQLQISLKQMDITDDLSQYKHDTENNQFIVSISSLEGVPLEEEHNTITHEYLGDQELIDFSRGMFQSTEHNKIGLKETLIRLFKVNDKVVCIMDNPDPSQTSNCNYAEIRFNSKCLRIPLLPGEDFQQIYQEINKMTMDKGKQKQFNQSLNSIPQTQVINHRQKQNHDKDRQCCNIF